ncbi:MAG: serine/threonine-protein kinase [Pirellulaceae bacterium]|nr:serine/threonine-protein kinase [Pirellulaceae bacterium]MDP6720477.1 serine/threonine-protein kinase [Pirellulaceae bacterium]
MSKLPDFLGPYRLAKFIRSGSSTQIWEAIKDDDSGRYVLKVLNRALWGNRDEIGYLKHEYDVAHGIDHPTVIDVKEFNLENKIGFLVLEVFTDLNIKQAMRERGHDSLHDNYTKIIEQAITSLQKLNEAGWVHCDVKPDNFLLNENAELKLIDFTISKRIAKGFSAMFRKRGTIRGTRSYMSPEQIRNEALDARADVYSLGCVMYELLHGRPPYSGESPDDLLNKHLKAPVPNIQVHNNKVTSDLAVLLRRMMAKDKDQRPESMKQLLKEFSSMRVFKPVAKRKTPKAE